MSFSDIPSFISTPFPLPPSPSRSVLDSVVLLLAGARVQKRLPLGRYAARWICLTTDLTSLKWRSNKRRLIYDTLNLDKVKSLNISGRKLTFITRQNLRIAIIFGTLEIATLWLNGLCCLVPARAHVTELNAVVSKRELFDPLSDSWNGRALMHCKHVNNYVLLGSIGKGAYTKEKIALCTSSKLFYSVEFIPKTMEICAATAVRNAEKQAVLRKLNHVNVVSLKDVLWCGTCNGFFIMQDYMPLGPVMRVARASEEGILSEDSARNVMRDVVAGLQYLHHQRIAHRDIRPDNLLRCGSGQVKLGMLGDAVVYDVITGKQRACIPPPRAPAFTAPELCPSEWSPVAPTEDFAADVWALGVTLYFLVYGRAPFSGKEMDIGDCICTQQLRFPENRGISSRLKNLLLRMLSKIPQERATLREVGRHAWFGNEVEQAQDMQKVRITQRDVEEAIVVARWTYPSSAQLED